MPAKGRYFLNEGDEGPNQAALYEKYRLTSQHGPLLLLLLLVAVATCIALVSIVFSHEDLRRHQAVLGTAFFMLTLFVALYVLVYVECLAQRWLRVLALLTWACLMILGSVLMWDSLENEAYAWEQVMAGADVTGLGYQQPEHAIGTFRPLVAVGLWEWANAACSCDPPCRLWCWISDGAVISLLRGVPP